MKTPKCPEFPTWYLRRGNKWIAVCPIHHQGYVLSGWTSSTYVGKPATYCEEEVVPNPPLRTYLPPQRPDTVEYTHNILISQLGRMVDNHIRGSHKGDTKEGRYLKQEERHKLGGLILQCRLLAEQLDCDWGWLIETGEEEFKERMLDIVRWRTTDREED